MDSNRYPRVDLQGYYWYDPSGFRAETAQPCFLCHDLTFRIDIDFDGYFCNSDPCNAQMEEDLGKYV